MANIKTYDSAMARPSGGAPRPLPNPRTSALGTSATFKRGGAMSEVHLIVLQKSAACVQCATIESKKAAA